MHSFLSFFDDECAYRNGNARRNNETARDIFYGDTNNNSVFPPEPFQGNVEYKLKLVNVSRLRFDHLVTQMNWRIREGQGEAIYEIGVLDDGKPKGLSRDEFDATLSTLKRMADQLAATTIVTREKIVASNRIVAEVLVRKQLRNHNSIDVRVALLGDVDAGKSTLLGVLTTGRLDNGHGRARLHMFRHLHEIQTGRTSSIAHEILGFSERGDVTNYHASSLWLADDIGETSAKIINFLDLAGHKKYIRTTVRGLSGYKPHYVMLVVASNAQCLDMTEEHLRLTLLLDVPFFVVINKQDVSGSTNMVSRLTKLLESIGCTRPGCLIETDEALQAAIALGTTVLPILPVSCVTGYGTDLLEKFLFQLPPRINSLECEKLKQESPHFEIDETFRAGDTLHVLGGLLVRGSITDKSNLIIGPLKDGTFTAVRVRSLHHNKAPCQVIYPGESASISLDRDVTGLRPGMVLLGADMLDVACSTYSFHARVTLLGVEKFVPGQQFTVHIGNVRQMAMVGSIVPVDHEQVDVHFVFVHNAEYVTIGSRMLLRDEHVTKGSGIVTDNI